MGVLINGKHIKMARLNGTQVAEMWLNGVRIWPEETASAVTVKITSKVMGFWAKIMNDNYYVNGGKRGDVEVLPSKFYLPSEDAYEFTLEYRGDLSYDLLLDRLYLEFDAIDYYGLAYSGGEADGKGFDYDFWTKSGVDSNGNILAGPWPSPAYLDQEASRKYGTSVNQEDLKITVEFPDKPYSYSSTERGSYGNHWVHEYGEYEQPKTKADVYFYQGGTGTDYQYCRFTHEALDDTYIYVKVNNIKEESTPNGDGTYHVTEIAGDIPDCIFTNGKKVGESYNHAVTRFIDGSPGVSLNDNEYIVVSRPGGHTYNGADRTQRGITGRLYEVNDGNTGVTTKYYIRKDDYDEHSVRAVEELNSSSDVDLEYNDYDYLFVHRGEVNCYKVAFELNTNDIPEDYAYFTLDHWFGTVEEIHGIKGGDGSKIEEDTAISGVITTSLEGRTVVFKVDKAKANEAINRGNPLLDLDQDHCVSFYGKYKIRVSCKTFYVGIRINMSNYEE